MAITMCINNWADSADFKDGTFNKHYNGLTGNRPQSPTGHIAKR